MYSKDFIKENFTVLAETENAIFYEEYDGIKICQVEGKVFIRNSVKEFYELVKEF